VKIDFRARTQKGVVIFFMVWYNDYVFLGKEVIFLNKELLVMLGKLAVGCAVIMTLIVIACLITPKIARFIEKRHPSLTENPERVDGDMQGECPDDNKVQGLYDKSTLDDWDPNYKIYNTDIYGVDFKHGKKQKRKDGK